MPGALGVVVTTGEVPIEGCAAVPVYVDDSLPAVGPARAVVLMPNGPFAGGPPQPVRLAPAGTPALGPALPVYVVSGSLSAAAAQTYTQKVLALSPIAYWPLNEAAGTTADNAEGTAARDGTYSNVTLGQTGIGDGNTAPSFNGTTSFCNIFSASLNTAFNNAEGTVAIWFQVSGAGVWTDGTTRTLYVLQSDASNRVLLRKPTGNNAFDLFYTAGGTAKQVSISSFSPTAWQHLALTWSKSADQVKAYLNGAQTGATQTGLGVWSGALNSAATVIGAGSTAPATPWSGLIAHAAVWATPLNASQIASLATVP